MASPIRAPLARIPCRQVTEPQFYRRSGQARRHRPDHQRLALYGRGHCRDRRRVRWCGHRGSPSTRDSLTYRAASTQRLLLVADDPDLLFEAQQRNAGTALNTNDIGLNANVQVVAGSTVTGYSASVVDTTGPATTNTLDLKIMGIVDDPVNDIGASASAGTAASRLLVRLNRHAYANQIAGV
jgi:hypothetical protein